MSVNLGSEIAQTPLKPTEAPQKPQYESLKISESVQTLHSKDQAHPILFLEVSLTQDQTVQLMIFEGENVKLRLATFCKEHGLTKEKKQKLVDVVNE